jgi:hypothetical protein
MMLRYKALDGRMRKYDPDAIDDEWTIVPAPWGYFEHGSEEHILYRHTDRHGAERWIYRRRTFSVEAQHYGDDPWLEAAEEITRERALALLAEIGRATPPDDDWPPIRCSESELARRMGYKPNYTNFSKKMLERGKIARYEQIRFSLNNYWLTDKKEHFRILGELEEERDA